MFLCVYLQGTKLAVVSGEDLIAILASNPRMKALLCETASAFIQREMGSIAGIERAVQAVTTPSLGQQMLQRGSRSAVANGVSREESSVSLNPEGDQVVKYIARLADCLLSPCSLSPRSLSPRSLSPRSLSPRSFSPRSL